MIIACIPAYDEERPMGDQVGGPLRELRRGIIINCLAKALSGVSDG